MSTINDRQIEELHKKLEARGEVKVRQDLAKGIYNPTSTKVKLAKESNQIAKGARNASRLALAISILALLVSSLIAIFKN